jgi:hypothetical protein
MLRNYRVATQLVGPRIVLSSLEFDFPRTLRRYIPGDRTVFISYLFAYISIKDIAVSSNVGAFPFDCATQ